MTKGRTFRERRRRKDRDLGHKMHTIPTYDVLKWMGNAGFRHSKRMKPYIFKDTGRGLLTEETIYAGDIIISVPESLLIKPFAILGGYLGPHIKKCCPSATGHEILSVFVMCEKAKGEASFWYSYITTFPSSYTIPAYCDANFIFSFPVSMRNSVLKQIDLVKTSFQKLNQLFISLELSFPEFHGIFQYNFFLWAWSSVNTRSIYFESENHLCKGKSCSYHMALAPFLDLMNHHYEAQAASEFNKEKRCYEVKSLKHFKKYSQVFINYGEHCNSKLFLEYGFVLKNNFNDIITVSLDDILAACKSINLNNKFIQKRQKFLLHCSLLSNLGICTDGLTWGMDILLKILCTKKTNKNYFSELCDMNLDDEEKLMYMKLAREIIVIKLKDFICSHENNIENIPAAVEPATQNILNIAKYLCTLKEEILLKVLHYFECCDPLL